MVLFEVGAGGEGRVCCFVERVVGADEVLRHGQGAVEVGEGRFGELRSGVEHRFGAALDALLLLSGQVRERERVVYAARRDPGVAFEAAADGAGPQGEHRRLEHPEQPQRGAFYGESWLVAMSPAPR